MLRVMQVGRSLAAGAVAALLLTIAGSHAAGEQAPPDGSESRK